MRLFLLISFLTLSGYGATYEDQLSKKAGEVVHFKIDYYDQTVGFRLYRKTGVTNSSTKLIDLPPDVRTFEYTMPSGTTSQYRFFAVPVDSAGVVGPATNEILVVRVK